MRWDEDMFENLVEGRSAVSCSDLLLAVSHCNERPKVRRYCTCSQRDNIDGNFNRIHVYLPHVPIDPCHKLN